MLGIIGAIPEEVQALKEKMEISAVCRKAGIEFCQGSLCGVTVTVACAGVGKVNAAICAQILISEFQVEMLINNGVAGGLAPGIHVRDVVISTDAMYHDYDTTALGFPLGHVAYMETSVFPADTVLRQLAAEACRRVLKDSAYHEGRIVSGDQFITGKERQKWLYETFRASCTEMEGAAIAHTAFLNGVPFLILRTISDGADDTSPMDYREFKPLAIETGTALLFDLLEHGIAKMPSVSGI